MQVLCQLNLNPDGKIELRVSCQESRVTDLIVIGGGLSGSEAAWQAAERGLSVDLYEMRPLKTTGAHNTDQLAELVCSNSLGSSLIDRASGLLKEELRQLGSLLMRCAQDTALPAGGALAVDREAFAQSVTRQIESHPLIRIIREEVTTIPAGLTVIASGPLTSESLTRSIQEWSGQDRLFFYDAIAPVVTSESINMEVAFRASRYGQGVQAEGDYLNCPLNKEQYIEFVNSIRTAERISLRNFETDIHQGVRAGIEKFFESCLPIEVIAERSEQALAFGPMRPTGLTDPRTGRWAAAIVQLRQDNLAGSLYNLVGFQTNLTFPEQRRVFHLIPGLENGEFVRYGQMHRNTFIASPVLLFPTLQSRQRSNLFFAGQITGVEGYMGNIATGLLAGVNAARVSKGLPPIELPLTTMLGALCRYITSADMETFQPMKANFGILPPPPMKLCGRKERNKIYVGRALQDIQGFLPDFSVQPAGQSTYEP